MHSSAFDPPTNVRYREGVPATAAGSTNDQPLARSASRSDVSPGSIARATSNTSPALPGSARSVRHEWAFWPYSVPRWRTDPYERQFATVVHEPAATSDASHSASTT